MKLFEIIWSYHAENELDLIFRDYSEVAGSLVAKKIVREIVSEPNKLCGNPKLGQCEEWLLHRPIEYRYLVCRQFKLIYSIDFNMKWIKIADVFDTRQNPEKMKRSQ